MRFKFKGSKQKLLMAVALAIVMLGFAPHPAGASPHSQGPELPNDPAPRSAMNKPPSDPSPHARTPGGPRVKPEAPIAHMPPN